MEGWKLHPWKENPPSEISFLRMSEGGEWNEYNTSCREGLGWRPREGDGSLLLLMRTRSASGGKRGTGSNLLARGHPSFLLLRKAASETKTNEYLFSRQFRIG